MKYKWTITKSTVNDSDVNVSGGRGCIDLEVNKKNAKTLGWKIEKWRTKSDDGNVMHESLIFGKNIEGFEPLDDFCMPDAGATTIEYWERRRIRDPKTNEVTYGAHCWQVL